MIEVNAAIAILCLVGAYIEHTNLPIAVAYSGFGLGYVGLTMMYGRI